MRNLRSLLVGLMIIVGFILTVVSYSGICSDACAEGKNFTLLGLPFELVGGIYFIGLFLLFILLPRNSLIVSLALAVGVGAELMFVFIQKYTIGSWCPICLGIGASLLAAALIWMWDYVVVLRETIQQGKRIEIWERMQRALMACLALVVGFVVALVGVTKHDDLIIAESVFEEKIVFGKSDSPIELYVFTSWICPACRSFEPKLERIISRFMEKNRVIFVDYGVDDITLNFVPYNLSFALHNKPKYFDLRHMLKDMVMQTQEPTDVEVDKAAHELGEEYKQLNYADVATALEYFKNLSSELKVVYLPAVVVMNAKTEKYEMLTGIRITAGTIQEAIDKVR